MTLNFNHSTKFYGGLFFIPILLLLSISLYGQNNKPIPEKTTVHGEVVTINNDALTDNFLDYDIYKIPVDEILEVKHRSNEFHFTLQLGNKYSWDLNLIESGLIGPKYREIIGTENGPVVLPPRENISFKGFLNPGGNVAITIDNNWIMGFVTTPSGDRLYIEPLSYIVHDAPINHFLVYRTEDIISTGNYTCGAMEVENRAPSLDEHDRSIHEDHETPESLTMMPCVELDFSIASTFDMINPAHNTAALVMNHVVSITTMMEAFYGFQPVQYLVNDNYVSAIATADPLTPNTATSNVDVLLPNFMSWAQGAGVLGTHDLAQMWTSRDIVGCGDPNNPPTNTSLIGCAYISAVCENFRYNVCEDFNPANIGCTAILSAHEIGHNWSLLHSDGPGATDIMGPSLACNETQFSAASMAKVTAYATGPNGACLSACAPPTNDLCADAFPIACGDVASGTTVGMTTDAGPPFCGTGITSPGVWYVFTGIDGNITADLCGATHDSKISVYSGSCAALTCIIGEDDDFPNCGGNDPQVEWASTAGTTYYILVHGFGGGTGTFDLTLTCAVGPPNDECADALPLACGADVTVDISGANGSDNPGTCVTFGSTEPGLWYTVTGTGGNINITTCNPGTDYDTKLSVWSGTCGALNCVTGNDDQSGSFDAACDVIGIGFNRGSTVDFCTELGTTYYVYLYGFANLVGTAQMTVTCDPLPGITCPDPGTFDCGDDVGITAWLNSAIITNNNCGETVTNDYDVADFDKCITTTNNITFSLRNSSGVVLDICVVALTINAAPIPVLSLPAYSSPITCSNALSFSIGDATYSNGFSGFCENSGTIPAVFDNNFDACGGNITVYYFGVDQCGNQISLPPLIIPVQPAAVPTITAPALPVSLSCDDAGNYTPPTASFSNGLGGVCNLSGTASSIVNHLYDACGGTIQVIYIGEDACGRSLAKNTTIIPVDPAPAPIIDVPSFPTSLSCSDAGSYVAPLASYNNGLDGDCNISGLVEPVISYNVNACDGGTMTITYNGTDDCGNILTTTPVVIQVEPASVPTLEAPKDVPATIYCWDAATGYYPGNATYNNGESGFCENSGEIIGIVTEFWNNCDGGYIIYDYAGVDDCGNELTPAVIKVSVLPDTWAPEGGCAPYEETTFSITDVPEPDELDYYLNQIATGYYDEGCSEIIVSVIDDTGAPQCNGNDFYERVYTVEITDECGNIGGECTITFSGSCSQNLCTMNQKFYGNPNAEVNGQTSGTIINALIANGINPIVIGDGTDCGFIIDDLTCIQAMMNSFGEAISLPAGFATNCFDLNNSLINQMVVTILNIRYNETMNPNGQMSFGGLLLSDACLNVPGFMLNNLPANPTVNDLLAYANDFIECQCSSTCGEFQPNMAELTNLFWGLNSRFNNCNNPDPCGSDFSGFTFEDGSSISKNTTFELYPNPTSDYINLVVKDFIGLPATIEIFDTRGARLGEKTYQPIEQNTLEFDVQDFSAGLYWLSIKVEGHDQIVKKFVVRN